MGLASDTVVLLSYEREGVEPLSRVQKRVPRRYVIHGCRHRPLRFPRPAEDGMSGFSVAERLWQTTAPPHPALLAAKASDRLEANGKVFHIIGPIAPFTDMAGRITKISVLSREQDVG